MNKTGILCPLCGTRLVTINKSGVITPMPGTEVKRIYRSFAIVWCQCGHEHKVAHDMDKAA